MHQDEVIYRYQWGKKRVIVSINSAFIVDCSNSYSYFFCYFSIKHVFWLSFEASQ